MTAIAPTSGETDPPSMRHDRGTRPTRHDRGTRPTLLQTVLAAIRVEVRRTQKDRQR